MKELHPKQSLMLAALKNNPYNSLSIRDLGEAIGVTSPGVIFHHLKQLERKGILKRNPKNSKDYVILDAPEKPIVYINVYGLATCGPESSMLDGNPIDKLPIASVLLKFPAAEAFIVKAKGDSMQPKINSGDIVIAQQKEYAEHGDIVVCTYESEVRIKKFHCRDGVVALFSLNEKYSPVVITNPNGLIIEGIVKNILSY